MKQVNNNMIRIRFSVLWIVLLFAAGLVFLTVSMAPSAQGDDGGPKTVTPLPSPTGNGGSATWTIGANTFTSNYPDGFNFTVQAQSSGGKITLATINWLHAPSAIHHANGVLDDSGTASADW